MKLIIDIPKKTFEDLRQGVFITVGETFTKRLIKYIKNGIPLPKEHGRLIILSENTVKREQTSLNFSCQNWISEVGLSNATVAIIKADKAERSDKEV